MLGQATGELGLTLTHYNPGSRVSHHLTPLGGEASTFPLGEANHFPLIVFSVTLHGAHIQMALFPGTPELESRNCPRVESRDFGGSYLSTVESDDNAI